MLIDMFLSNDKKVLGPHVACWQHFGHPCYKTIVSSQLMHLPYQKSLLNNNFGIVDELSFLYLK